MRKSSLCSSNTSIIAANCVPSRNMYIWLGCSRPRPVPNDRTRNSAIQALASKKFFKGHWTASSIFLSMSPTKATIAGVCAAGRLSSFSNHPSVRRRSGRCSQWHLFNDSLPQGRKMAACHQQFIASRTQDGVVSLFRQMFDVWMS